MWHTDVSLLKQHIQERLVFSLFGSSDMQYSLHIEHH
jgi:hypothetical protein